MTDEKLDRIEKAVNRVFILLVAVANLIVGIIVGFILAIVIMGLNVAMEHLG